MTSKQGFLENKAQTIAQAYPKSAHFSKKIVQVARNLGTNPYWLANLINFESAGTFSPSITNSLGYTGLIQFGTGAASDLGTTTAYLRGLSAEEQMDWVEKYFELRHKRMGSKYDNPIDLYMAVFWPPAVGKDPKSKRFPQNVIDANNGIDTPYEYARRANLNARLPTGMNSNQSPAITQSSNKTIQMIPKWVFYSSTTLLLISLTMFVLKRKKK